MFISLFSLGDCNQGCRVGV